MLFSLFSAVFSITGWEFPGAFSISGWGEVLLMSVSRLFLWRGFSLFLVFRVLMFCVVGWCQLKGVDMFFQGLVVMFDARLFVLG